MFLDPQDEVAASISSSVVLCSFVCLVHIVVLVLVVCLCPSSVHVVATFSGTVLFHLLCSMLTFFPNTLIFFYLVLLFQVSVSLLTSYFFYTSYPKIQYLLPSNTCSLRALRPFKRTRNVCLGVFYNMTATLNISFIFKGFSI